jgi:hypothetical protein
MLLRSSVDLRGARGLLQLSVNQADWADVESRRHTATHYGASGDVLSSRYYLIRPVRPIYCSNSLTHAQRSFCVVRCSSRNSRKNPDFRRRQESQREFPLQSLPVRRGRGPLGEALMRRHCAFVRGSVSVQRRSDGSWRAALSRVVRRKTAVGLATLPL